MRNWLILTAYIVDDEPLARVRLHRLLESQGVLICGEAEDASTALQKVQLLKPDLLFLDIQMPDTSGLQVAAALLQLESIPLLIFVTGYSEYAVTSFELNALDYLVKPVTVQRLALTIIRAREYLADKHARVQADKNVSLASSSSTTKRCLPVRMDYALRFLPIDEILCAISRKRQVFVLTKEREYRIQYTLTHLETLLPPEHFLRIHDSALVRLDDISKDWITAYKKYFHTNQPRPHNRYPTTIPSFYSHKQLGPYQESQNPESRHVKIRNQTELPVSKRRATIPTVA